jgi:4-hydroxy 2-oxovalerate aldolase
LDGTAKGFGAGAGNTALEVLVAVLHKMNYQTNIDLYKLFDACDFAETKILNEIPTISTMSLVSGLYGVFSGFLKPVNRIAKTFRVDAREILKLLGENKILAGQEDLIMEFAQKLKSERESNFGPSFNETDIGKNI